MKQKHPDTYLSPTPQAIKRLFKNKPAIGGLIVIALAILVAIFGHIIAPDSTPYANEQVLEIATQSPNFSVQMLQKHKNRPIEQEGFLKLVASGRQNKYQQVPMESYSIEGANIIVQPFWAVLLLPKKIQFRW